MPRKSRKSRKSRKITKRSSRKRQYGGKRNKNLKNRFGVNVSNITVVNNQFIIEDKKHTIEGNLNLNRLNTLNQKIKSISKNRLN